LTSADASATGGWRDAVWRAAIVPLEWPATSTTTTTTGRQEQTVARDDRSFKADHPSGPAAVAACKETFASTAAFSRSVDPALDVNSIAGNKEHGTTTAAISEAAAVVLTRTTTS